MISIDHFCLGAKNLYESTFRVSQETGIGNYDGGFFPGYGIANKIIPLGGDLYIEVESFVDPFVAQSDAKVAKWFYNGVSKGDAFMGWCLRADTLAELQRFADLHRTKVLGVTNGAIDRGEALARHRMNGTLVAAASAPYVIEAWPQGYPNMYWWDDMTSHPSRLPVEPGTARVIPKGIGWLEVGGTQQQLQDWLGWIPVASFPLRFNGKAPGLHAIAVNTEHGEVVIRRPPVTAIG